MKKRLLTTLFGVLSVFSAAFAEDVNYSGTVVSKNGEPIMGATVTVTGTTVSTITDMDGNFSIVVPDGYTTVTITYSGMKKQTVAIQRAPVVLYESAEQAEQARLLAQKNTKKSLKKPYKKNAFNWEMGFGWAMGGWNDAILYLADDDHDQYLSLNLGWHHGYNQYITWEVFNLGVLTPVSNFVDNFNDFANAYMTTGIKFTTPRWKKLSLSYSLNLGADYDWWSEEFNFMMRHKVSLNFGKWVYVAFNYNVVKLNKDEYEYDLAHSYNLYHEHYYGDNVEKLQIGMIALGFNF